MRLLDANYGQMQIGFRDQRSGFKGQGSKDGFQLTWNLNDDII